MQRTATDCIAAGLLSLRANWQLVPVLWLQTFLVAALTVGGVVPVAVAVGLGRVRPLGGLDLEAVTGWLERLSELSLPDLIPRSPALVAALLAMVMLWTLALLVYCGFQAGVFGVLVAAERRAAGARDWRSYIAFEALELVRCGRLYLWRFFALVHLLALYLLGILLVQVISLLATVWGAWVVGRPAAWGLGCLGLLAVAALLAVVLLWFGLARAALAHPLSDAAAAQRHGFRVLRRRLPAVLGLGLLSAALGLAATLVWLPADLLLARRLETGALAAATHFGLEASRWLVYSALAVFSAAVRVALMAGEIPLAEVG